MSQIQYSISFDLGAMMQVASGFNSRVLPLMRQAVEAVAEQGANDWREAVNRAKLWSGEKDAYAQSITWRMTSDDGLTAVIEADYKHAAEIETGRPARDLKKMLDTSSKVRRTLDGRRFLVIPMRQNTPGNSAHAVSMPAGVHALAKKMTPSRVTGMGQRESGEVVALHPAYGMSKGRPNSNFMSDPKTKQHFLVASRSYAWGDRVTKAMLRDAGVDASTVKRYAGMVKMQTTTPGGKKSNGYMTFRIMMDGQAGKWVIPSKPGLFLVKKVADDLRPRAEAAFAGAVQRTFSG